MLRIQKDFDHLKNAEPQLQTDLKSLTETTTIASGTKVISARVKIKRMQQRAMKRHSVRKIARTHKANKRKSSIRKIHISIEKNIHVTHCKCCCSNIIPEDDEKVSQENSIREFQIERRQLKKLILIFSVRMLKEIFLV
jgi:glutamate-1-semialdehyde aminotransferase